MKFIEKKECVVVMNIALWTTQIVLALLFFMTGLQKVNPSKKEVEQTENGSESRLFMFIGIVEILGAIGLIFPWLLNIMPILTPLAAIGFSIIMILAAIYHMKRKEYKSIAFNTILFALALFIAIGRIL
ncbi:DoxX family protein [Fervidibacillus albus]|uniref:DoxX family protein n=1 Tax=Fervidibacillus albus TaxID=2980026 RepID=A0A9E8RVY3_9BACI|nr:DoxX family protein [Fervidibacillus albus]WAA11160.1 DoxX family protein [Fervidibacillus albus]